MTLKENLEKASSNIRAAQIRSGIDHPVEIVGVTKTHPFSYIEESFEVGIRSIGENRVQEAQKKFTSFDKLPGLKKRFIGHLQSNKIKKCVDLFDTVDSVHSYKTLKKIFHHSHNSKKNISVLLEVNTSGERQKNGFLLSQKDEIIKCFSTTGNGSHILYIRTANTDSLERLLSRIQQWPGVISTETQLILSTYKDR